MPDDALDKEGASPDRSSLFSSVPIEIMVCAGKARPLIRDLLAMGENAVMPLDTRVDDPVELFVGDRLIARGMLEELDGEHEGQLAVRLTEVAELGRGLE
ncbi:FliM/FliN family flagellar motor C-terminal domain-containing protein [Rhodalgimonas zhirmunskyi]|uniref:FliM/FliN family flagellar motor C-terminal domain-containing protein n=1 Tax=Rhodalgimonas zhirmunskyi TaxID=2964767 RepID=A0AAJ1UDH5_9RHOB|nr:FliM/FliN family flagellar motor C-terminal domain-containing protein [Rhodoalgimonas zhirmunskyi]MDQ2093972.1 FliM/FliN family flagellar motor C-terminal domain-containing protein [Rhodoalgimonas zhirmunskyi]